jgi:CBS domain-containing protein
MSGSVIAPFVLRKIPTIEPEASTAEAVNRLRSSPGGIIAVCDHGRLLGTLTEREVAVESQANGHPTSNPTVREILADGLSCCFEDTDADVAEVQMQRDGVDRLVVLSREGGVVGILPLASLMNRNTQ